MILRDYRKKFSESLRHIYPSTEIDTFFFLLTENYLGLQRIDTSLRPDFQINNKQLNTLNNALKRLQKENPVQYIVGKTHFYGFPFLVNRQVLIPRPETEELVEWVIHEVESGTSESQKAESWKVESEKRTGKNMSVLDIGTGSGCIAITLKKHLPNAAVSAIDISKEAIITATKNAKLNDVYIHFLVSDILTTRELPEKYDIMISNPPYVRISEMEKMKNNVLQNEPHLALFVANDNPLLFYDKIADLAICHLSESGILYFEINQYLGKEIIELLKEKGFSTIVLRKDIFGNDRMIKAIV
ncbi:MAG: peptide chain release factor N(5)-glutamine methyltransferase [Flavobacteriaceae bacterium]|nr:MAG: peptide chain release factor N(5)-glutamine methyltransferase [Flavobacteriaceae bacterium]